MKKFFGLILLIACAGLLFRPSAHPKYEPLPVPISNNAVASVKSRGSLLLYSMMGIGPKKTWDAISNSGYIARSDRYREMGRGAFGSGDGRASGGRGGRRA